MSPEDNQSEQSLLSYYGKPLAEYGGKGILTLETQETVSCTFQAGQLTNGDVLLLCEVTTPVSLSLWSEMPANKFEGTTSKGFRITTAEISREITYLPDIPQGREGTWAAYHLRQMLVQIADNSSVQRARFGLTNFEFVGNTPKEVSKGHWLSVLSLRLENDGQIKELFIEPLHNYRKVISRVRTLRGIDVTCEAVVDFGPGDDIEKVKQALDDLCLLLSVSRGTKIQWVYCDRYDEKGALLSRIHSARITKPYCMFVIIERDGLNETKNFIEVAYPNYITKRDDYNLNKGTIEAYLEAKAEGDYLETRGVKLVIAIEMLKNIFLDIPNSPIGEYIIGRNKFDKISSNIRKVLRDLAADYTEEDELDVVLNIISGHIGERRFQKISDKLREAVDSILSTKNITDDERDAMIEKVSELNRPPFRSVLEKLIRDIGLNIEAEDLNRFIRSRNSLVHTGRFSSQQEKTVDRIELTREWLFLVNFLDKVFLKLLGYSGPYIDWSEPSNPTTKNLD